MSIFLSKLLCNMFLLGSEVDKPFKILIITLNAVEYIFDHKILSCISNIEVPRIDDLII